MLSIVRVTDIAAWDAHLDAPRQRELLELLEDGQVLWFPQLEFALHEIEQRLRSPSVSDGHSKNIAFDPQTQRLSGTALSGSELETMRTMMSRFSDHCTRLIEQMLPDYAGALQTRLVSFRPLEIQGRDSSDRKNDTRLHVDAFASRPNQGQRILRVFSNVNPSGKPRTWLVGEPFEPYARRFLPQVRPQWPLEAALLQRLKITKQRRTRYDHCMLQLHDHGKLDEHYQRETQRERIDFPPGSTWVCFTDQVLHAALAGQYLLEQTYLLPASAMLHPERSPLRTLERLTGRALV